MGKYGVAFVVAFAWSSSARAEETERSGVSFGLSGGLGTISRQGPALFAGWRVGYALTPRVVLLGDVAGFLWGSGDPPAPTVSVRKWTSLSFLSLTTQLLVLPRLWVRPGFGLAQWDAVRYTATSTGQQMTDLSGSGPCLNVAVGVDAAAGKHSVFDIAFSSFAFSRDHKFTYAGALVLGYSYY